MDIRTRSPSLSAPIEMKQEQDPLPQDKISAYYSLVFPHFTFYIQTLSVTIGRRCAPNPSAATSSTSEPVAVDVDLGALKSVSRLHAKIEFDQDEDRFVLAVIGRNGAWVDGVWSASGTRAPLGERSQIQIASRTFLFVLPPPPPPEDTPSPSSQSSNNRARSPSLDITSISPPSSQPSYTPPPSKEHRLPAPPPEPQLASKILPKPEFQPEPKPPPAPSQPQLPNSNAIGKSNKVTSKKRKKGDDLLSALKPKPDEMPPKPPFTYAQLIYRAIKSIGEKATLQEICSWIMSTHEYYQYADGAWMSSVRHNLSSSRAFLKLERCGGDRGKGFFWTLDEKHSQALEDQEAKAAGATGSQAGGKDGKGRKKDKGILEPALKRSIKGDLKGGPLPPPLTSTPLVMKSSTITMPTPTSTAASMLGSGKTMVSNTTSATTGVFAYPTHPHQAHMQTISQSSAATPGYSASTTNPYAALTRSHWGVHSITQPNPSTSPSSTGTTSASPPLASFAPKATVTPGPSLQTPQMQSQPPQAPDVIIPIILGPIPAAHADYAPTHPNNSVKEGYMVLHERTLILDPDVFSGLTKERLAEIEQMGMRAALGLLTTHMVKALKERRAKERGKGRERGARRGRGTGKRGGSVAASSGPFTNTPLERRSMGATDVSCGAGPDETAVADIVQVKPPTPVVIPIPDPVPMDIGGSGQDNMGSPIVIIDDSDDDGPAAKRRKVEAVCG